MKMNLKTAIQILRQSGIDSPEHDAREIFRAYCTEPIFSDTECDDPRLESAIERRKNREPLQYILGSVGFYREEYKVTPDCLIPRSDTELLVDYAVKNIPCGERFADLCEPLMKRGERSIFVVKKVCDSADLRIHSRFGHYRSAVTCHNGG